MLFVDSQGGVDYSACEYIDQWDVQLHNVQKRQTARWANGKGKWRPSVAVVLLDTNSQVLVIRENDTWRLPVYALEGERNILIRAFAGIMDQLGIDSRESYRLWPHHPVLFPSNALPRVRNIGNQPDEDGFIGTSYCGVALKLKEPLEHCFVLSCGGNRQPIDFRWLAPPEALRLMPVSDEPHGSPAAAVFRSAVNIAVKLSQAQERTRVLLEQRSFA